MALNDPIADAFSKINNAVRSLYKSVELENSKFMQNILDVLKQKGYVGSYTYEEDGKQGKLQVQLLGTINTCRVIKPRYSVKVDQLEQFERKYLPAKNFGVLLISTSKGIITQNEAREQNVGGQLIAYCY